MRYGDTERSVSPQAADCTITSLRSVVVSCYSARLPEVLRCTKEYIKVGLGRSSAHCRTDEVGT